MKDFFGNAVVLLVYVYMITSQIMTVYFWYMMVKHGDSFLAAIFWYPIVAEIKGLLWIFFIW